MDRELLIRLIDEANQHNQMYMRREIDRDTWTKEMRELDERMQLFGLQFTSRPWENRSARV